MLEMEAPFLCQVVKQLREVGSWCGETHVQKTVFAATRLAKLDDVNFIIYKYGPFSFHLRDEINELVAGGFLAVERVSGGKGQCYRLTRQGENLAKKSDHVELIKFVSRQLGPQPVKHLEAVTTALFVKTGRSGSVKNEDQLVDEIVRLKPHLDRDAARQALTDASTLEDGVAASV